MRKFKENKLTIYAGILLLGTISAIKIYEDSFDHTKCDCVITKALNLIPVEEDEIPLGNALHQEAAIRKDLSHMGYDDTLVTYLRGKSYDHITIYADREFINNYGVMKRRKK